MAFDKVFSQKSNEVTERLTSAGFTISKSISSAPFVPDGLEAGNILYIDDVNKRFAIATFKLKKLTDISGKTLYFDIDVYNYKDLVKFEFYEDGKSVLQGKAGSALVGSFLFGDTGAVIGAAGKREVKKEIKKIQVIFTINNLSKPVAEFNIFNLNKYSDKLLLDTSRDISSTLELILKQLTDGTDLTPKTDINFNILHPRAIETQPQAQAPVTATTKKPVSKKWILFVLCLLFGTLGVHKFYEKKYLLGVLYLFTLGLFGIGVLVDLITILTKPASYYDNTTT